MPRRRQMAKYQSQPGVTLYDRVAAKLRPEGDCLVFTGYRNKARYGRIGSKYKQHLTHRVVWEHFNGPIPEGYFVCHSCDNPPCCKREHLWLGTPRDNTRDALRKGRWWRGGRKAQRHPQNDPTMQATQVRVRRDATLCDPKSLFARRVAHKLTSMALAERSGVAFTTIWRIETGRSKRPHVRVMGAIAGVLGVAPGEITEFLD
jgi:hypothetical protein